jgi:hypothetical protein
MADKPSLSEYIKFRNSMGGVISDPESEHAKTILDQVRQYDPNATWQTGAAGEGGATQTTLQFDESKLPAMKGDKDRNAVRWVGEDTGQHQTLIDPKAVWQDELYGTLSDSSNFKKQQDPLWVKLAPLVVSMVAPAAGAAFLASTGVGLGAAGTAAVTGGAAGLGAGNIASGGQASILSRLASKAPQLARQADNGSGDVNSLLGAVAGAVGVPYSQLIAPALALATGGKGSATQRPSIDPRLAALLALAAKRGR